MSQLSNKLIIKDPFEMPVVDDTTVLVLRECADLVPHCWIWNESVGYLEVVAYSGYDIYVTVKNVGMKENATSGTIFPSCMEFLITAPNATPIIDNTVTCLRADFKCPTVGQEALMSVDSTSAIRTGDLIIVDTRYQYLVTEIINEHTMKVLNEEKGKEGGVINVNCNECVPVKIFESTHCCEALQKQVDDIYNRLDTKKSITPATDSLISVSNGSQVLTDAFNDVVLDVNTDLSKYDNTISRFITLNDIPQIPTVNDATLTIYNSDGVTPFIEFSANASEAVTAILPQSGTTYTADSPLNIADNKITISQASATTDGYLSSTDWNTFNNKSGGLSYFGEYKDSNNVAKFRPISGTANAFDLGSSVNDYTTAYIRNIRKDNSYISLPSNGGDININCGTGGTYHTNYGDINFNIGNGNKLNLQPTQAVFDVNVVRKSSSNLSLGTSTNAWYEGWIQFVKTNQLKTVNGTSISVQSDLNPGSAGSQSIGNSTHFNTIHGETVRVKYLVPGAGNASSIEVKTADNTGTIQLISNTATRNIGTSNNMWSNGYFSNLFATNTYSNTVEPNTADTTNGAGHVGSAAKPYNNVVSYQIHTRTVYASNSSIQSWTWPSDSKLKSNIALRKNKSSLNKLAELSTYSFTYDKQLGITNKDLTKNSNSNIGFIAEEVEKILPDCVETIIDESTNEEYKSIKMYPLITMMLESIQELSAEVKELKVKLGVKDAISKVLEK